MGDSVLVPRALSDGASLPQRSRTSDTGIADAVWKTAPMRVSAKADYALRALIEMGARVDGTQAPPVSAEELGRLQDIPHNFLQAILADLRKAGIVHAQRGQSGGWRLAKDAAGVSVADVIRAVDGPLVSVYGLRPEAVSYNERADALQRVWIAARHSLRDVFEQVSVAHLASGKLPAAVARLTEDEDAWQPH
jgi:Rrf2 family protein